MEIITSQPWSGDYIKVNGIKYYRKNSKPKWIAGVWNYNGRFYAARLIGFTLDYIVNSASGTLEETLYELKMRWNCKKRPVFFDTSSTPLFGVRELYVHEILTFGVKIGFHGAFYQGKLLMIKHNGKPCIFLHADYCVSRITAQLKEEQKAVNVSDLQYDK